MRTIRVTIWNENRHEKTNEDVRRVYPDGIHGALAAHLQMQPGLQVRTATLDEPEHGLTDDVLKSTDVLTWWGHMAHGDVRDEIVDRVQQRVLDGMGLVVLHSGHHAKIFRRLMGTSCNLRWRVANEVERVWVVNPAHPIAAGLPPHFELREEMYGEFFDVPPPDDLVFVSWFEGGEVFRSGCTWTRGKGRIFYFRPGHETYPTFRDSNVLRVIENGIRWAAFAGSEQVPMDVINVKEPLSPIRST
jgi:trehalose utilization protein